MNRLVSTSALLAMLFLMGCASTPHPVKAIDDTAFYLARFDKVWDASLATLAAEQIPLDNMNKEKGILLTKFVNYSVGPQAHHEIGAIAQKPSAARLAFWSQVGYTLSILITPINDMSTKVKVTAHIEAYDKNVSQEWHECISNKVIENRIIEKIRAQL